MSVRLRIDGVMYPAEAFDRSTGDALVNIFKVLSAMDITERRKAQDGSFRAEMEGRTIDFRVATQGLQGGEKMVIRILDKGATAKTLSDLGMRKQLVEQMQAIVSQPHGMFLTCGPTGAGKSTTLYAALQEINAYENNIITVEDPVEYKMPNVTQIEINSKAGQTFAKSSRSCWRVPVRQSSDNDWFASSVRIVRRPINLQRTCCKRLVFRPTRSISSIVLHQSLKEHVRPATDSDTRDVSVCLNCWSLMIDYVI